MTRAGQIGSAVLAAGAAALGVASWLYLVPRADPPPQIAGYLLAEPRALPSVDLVDETGERFTSAAFAGHWSFLYFGYTYCPDVCPLSLLELARVKEQLLSELPDEHIEYYLISVDPKRDTPERLREYVAYFDPAFHGLTGPPPSLAALAGATETLFLFPDGQEGDHYLVSHSSNIVLLNPAGRVEAIFPPPHPPEQLAADFVKIETHAGSRR